MKLYIVVIFIISITLFLITKYYYLSNIINNENIEQYESDIKLTPTQQLLKIHTITIHYLTLDESRSLITKIREGEYLRGMNQANLSARNCINKDDLYNKYLDGFDKITSADRQKIDIFILELLNNIKSKNNTSYYNYVCKWLQIISIAKAKPWLEAGMPHTLDTTIIMDYNWFDKPRKSTFLHEISHVHQRQSIMDFEDIYAALGYIYNPIDIRGMEEIYPLNRNNPDGTSKYWLWHNNSNIKTYWWIGAIFKNITPNNLTDVELIALELDSSDDNVFYYVKQNKVLLSNLEPFISFFGENPNNYHPNEMTSKFAEWYLDDMLSNKLSINTDRDIYKGYLIYKKNFDKMINKYYK